MEFINEIRHFVGNHPILSISWAVLLIMVINLTLRTKLSKVKIVTNGQAIQLINNENAIVVDVRSNDDFKRGHITDSYNILPIDIQNGSIKAIEKFKDNPIIVVTDIGAALRSGDKLIKAGFSHVYTLTDGITGWNSENLPLVRK
ncbi:rhodanese-like domain-containing protein [Candidatus Schmidhempelia bombi]|jgi:rhodanese-related sulfurtransferase|uniref:rhodanese-like domain-containing protein n=1 Tax=Candidatus Schmidhempelia bombi TaxID=1505866 RepID=UPI0006845C3F|nr:rhodanese-like domain-containing protein [Candidatus Schmidhempelia bombi]